MTSQSVEGRDFPDLEMIDANDGLCIEEDQTDQYFRRRVTVEEQKAEKYDKILKGRQTTYMIHDIFRTHAENEAVLDLSVLFQYLFARRWHSEFQALLSASEVPKEIRALSSC